MTLTRPTPNTQAGTRDFLTPTVRPYGSTQDELNSLIGYMSKHGKLLEDISKQLRKLNPDILCTTVVQSIGLDGRITDNNVHKIWFEESGKAVEVYKVLMFGYDSGGDISISIEPNPMQNDGWVLAKDPTNNLFYPTTLNVPVRNLYIRGNTGASANPYSVNVQPAQSTKSVIWLYGYTSHPLDEF